MEEEKEYKKFKKLVKKEPPAEKKPKEIVSRDRSIFIPPLRSGTATAAELKRKSGINIHVKQIQNEKAKRRSKKAKTATKSAITAARKRYTTLKKRVTKALRVGKKKQYDFENAKIKDLPPAQRKASRAKLHAQLKGKLGGILAKMKPGTHYKNISNVESAILQMKKYKW